MGAAPPSPTPKPVETREAEIAREAYAFLYPLVIMDVTRRQALQRGGSSLAAPVNTFHHSPAFPRGDFKAVVRPNFDTLYSSAWLDLGNGPVLLSIGDTKNRYYMLPLYDAWTDTFAIPGSETLPAGKTAKFAITGPGWQGILPAGVERIDAPTRFVWIIGRIQTNGVSDYPVVHQIQKALTLAPLDPAKPAPLASDAPVDLTLPPVALVNRLSATEFYETALRLMVDNPPHLVDQAQVARLGLIGLRAARDFRFAGLSSAAQAALADAKTQGPARILRYAGRNGQQRNGWRLNTLSVGTYGADYDQRAAVALVGLGANRPTDSIYPSTSVDRDGKALSGQEHYVVRFKVGELPPARAFWSLTAYTPEGYTEPNAIDRYAVGDRDALSFNPDGSLDLLLQNDDPGADRRANWLPVPRGPFNLSLRIYRPAPSALEGDWPPPAIERTIQK
ncbi:MAG: DUF1254 domain-containing protein [Novosphingobium sp.]|nr:MAG: DUF1254 domain-containing protein [Novosphingobium sp.]